MTTIAPSLPRRTAHSAENGRVPTKEETDELRGSVGRKVAYLFSRLRQADRIKLWKQNNPAPEVPVYVPRHLGEAVDESTMPAMTEPKHAAGAHALEMTDASSAAHEYKAENTQQIVGRHVAEVPVDYIPSAAGKHRA